MSRCSIAKKLATTSRFPRPPEPDQYRGEVRLADPALHHPSFTLNQLQLGQTQEVAEMIGTFGRALPRQPVVLAQKGRQLERLEMMGKQHLWCVAHGRSSPSKPR
jgi:hypothetical protein